MAEHEPTMGREATGDGWGLVIFAGVMMILLGGLHAVAGLTAILKDKFFVFTPSNYVISVDVTTWGWIHLIAGVVVVLAGVFGFSGTGGQPPRSGSSQNVAGQLGGAC